MVPAVERRTGLRRTSGLQRGASLRRSSTPINKATSSLDRSTGRNRTTPRATSSTLDRNTGLSRGTPLARTDSPRPRSEKMETIYRQRRPLVEKLLTERPRCQFANPDGARCHRRSSEVHEIWTRGRSGNTAAAILNEDNCLALCAAHHHWITENPVNARLLGYLRHAWEGPPPPPDADHPDARIPLGTPREPTPYTTAGT